MVTRRKIIVFLLLPLFVMSLFSTAIANESVEYPVVYTSGDKTWMIAPIGPAASKAASLQNDITIAFTDAILEYLPEEIQYVDTLSLQKCDTVSNAGITSMLLVSAQSSVEDEQLYAVGAIVTDGIIDWQRCTLEATDIGLLIGWPESAESALNQAEEVFLILFATESN